MKRKLSALLALLMLVPLAAACASDGSGQTDTTTADNAGTTTAVTEPELTSAVPKDVDLDGFEVTIFHSGDDVLKPEEEMDSGDIVHSAILEMRTNLSEKLNIDLNIMPVMDQGFKDKIQTDVLAGSTDYDLIIGYSYDIATYVTEGYYHNLLNLEYANYDADWWAGDWMNEAAVGDDARYMAVGDIVLSKIQQQSCVYFNKGVYADYFEDPNEMYTLVDEGEWVLDKFTSMSQDIYSDLNGNSEKDIDDRYAMILHTVNLTDHLAYDTGFRATRRDADGVPYLDVVNEKNVAFVEKLYDLFYNNNGTFVVSVSEAANANNVVVPNKFSNNELLFALGWLTTSSKLRDMEGDFGIIPFPKYDEQQDNYIALCHDSTRAVVIPITVSDEDADKVSAVMEEMAFLGWRDVTPTYYEVALKVKYIRDSDDLSLRIIDTIANAATTDFAYIYNYALDGVGLIMRKLMGDKNADIASYYASIEPAVQTKFNTLIEHFTSIE